MSAVETLASARAAGVRLGLDGTDRLIEADCTPPRLDALRHDKPKILVKLRARETGELPSATATAESPNLHRLSFAELEEAAVADWTELRGLRSGSHLPRGIFALGIGGLL